jgi:hypothetical protein
MLGAPAPFAEVYVGVLKMDQPRLKFLEEGVARNRKGGGMNGSGIRT